MERITNFCAALKPSADVEIDPEIIFLLSSRTHEWKSIWWSIVTNPGQQMLTPSTILSITNKSIWLIIDHSFVFLKVPPSVSVLHIDSAYRECPSPATQLKTNCCRGIKTPSSFVDAFPDTILQSMTMTRPVRPVSLNSMPTSAKMSSLVESFSCKGKRSRKGTE